MLFIFFLGPVSVPSSEGILIGFSTVSVSILPPSGATNPNTTLLFESTRYPSPSNLKSPTLVRVSALTSDNAGSSFPDGIPAMFFVPTRKNPFPSIMQSVGLSVGA